MNGKGLRGEVGQRLNQTGHRQRSGWRSAQLALGLLLLAGLILSALPTQAMIDNGLGKVWIQKTNIRPISNYSRIVAFKNKMWSLDLGTDERHSVISSSENGARWQEVTDSAPFSAADQQLIDFQGKLWALSISATARNNWFSDDGSSWTLVNSSPAPGNLESIFIHNNKLWAFGHIPDITGKNSTGVLWSSTNSKTWTRATQAEPFRSRFGTALVSFAGKLWFFGGGVPDNSHSTYAWKNDIWSSDDGIQWTRRASSAAWSPRMNHSVIVFEDNIWLMGGYDQEGGLRRNDVWRSSDGIHWIQITPAASWESFQNLSLFIFANQIWVCDEDDGSPYYYDLWSSSPMPLGTPQIAPIPLQRAQERIAYTGPEPVLFRGSRPITWSLTKGPAGMSIDRKSGIVTWPAPTLAGSPQTVTLRASNINGHSEVSWQLTVNPQTPATLSIPAWSAGTQCTVSWTAQPNVSGYTLQRDDAPDFKTPLQTVTLPAKTQQYTFTNLPDNRTFWYRVMGQKTGGLTSVWSRTVSCAQDAAVPRGAIKINGGAASTNSYLITLNLSAQDPGTHPSGVTRMRFSWNGLNWSDWEPFAAKKTYKLAPEGVNQRIHAQFQDRVGNLSSPVSAGIQCLARPTCVDDDNTSGPWQGTPDKPYRHIQDAIDAAPLGAYIYVAHGTYAEHVKLKSGLTLMGSFDAGQFNLATRNLQINTTITTPLAADDALGKTVLLDSVSTVTLEGFRITGAVNQYRVALDGDGIGCGLYCRNVNRSCFISHCTIDGFDAVYIGAWHDTFSIFGGGIFLEGASPVIADCLIANNRANDGGGIYCANSAPLITNCRIQNNAPVSYEVYIPMGAYVDVGGVGGGIYAAGSSPIVQNCMISDNSGSGIDSSAGSITNCTIYGNGLCQCTGPIKNCIIWGDQQGQLSDCSTPTYSDIQGWTGGGTGNLALDPQFTTDGTFHLQLTSPCIDAGGFVPGLTTDLDGRSRPIKRLSAPRGDGSGFDIGAFEY